MEQRLIIGSGLAKGIKSFKKGMTGETEELTEKKEEPMASASDKPSGENQA